MVARKDNIKKEEIKAKINPDILRWAREAVSLSHDDVCRRLANKSITQEIIKKWEEGEDLPTIPIAKQLATLYGVKFISFYLPFIPKNIKPLKDFRGVGEQLFSRNFVLLMREIQGKQEWIKEYLLSKGKPPLKFVGSIKTSDDVSGLVSVLNKIILKEYKLKKKAEDNLNPLIALLESIGVFVSIANSFNGHHLSAVSPQEVRGFAIADKIAPFIFINSKDAKNAQLFTLIHEFCHILLGETGICDISRHSTNEIETLCNKAAAEFLMPTEKFVKEIDKYKSDSLDEVVLGLAKQFPVSTFSVLIKMFSLKYINEKTFNEAYEEQLDGFKKFQAQEKTKIKLSGKKLFVDQFIRVKRLNGKNFIGAVLEAYTSGVLPFTNTCSVLSIRNISKLETYFNKWGTSI